MKKIVGYLREYLQAVDKRTLFGSTVFTALLVFCNYYFRINHAIGRLPIALQYTSWYFLFLLAFAVGYWLYRRFAPTDPFKHRKFIWLLLLAPAVFSWKMVYRVEYAISTDVLRNEYWNAVLYWPFKVAVITLVLYLVRHFFDRDQPFYGVTAKKFSVRPYLMMLLIMVPLVAAAATQKDFLQMYPRMQKIAFLSQADKGLYILLYQLAYGSDFFSIELFFRGFLVLAFARYAGKGVILPMAIFYCTIHFGKPLGECISSYFGGIILGVVSYHTRTILGGFMVHVGIAWLMELGGYLAKNSF